VVSVVSGVALGLEQAGSGEVALGSDQVVSGVAGVVTGDNCLKLIDRSLLAMMTSLDLS